MVSCARISAASGRGDTARTGAVVDAIIDKLGYAAALATGADGSRELVEALLKALIDACATFPHVVPVAVETMKSLLLSRSGPPLTDRAFDGRPGTPMTPSRARARAFHQDIALVLCHVCGTELGTPGVTFRSSATRRLVVGLSNELYVTKESLPGRAASPMESPTRCVQCLWRRRVS